MPPDTTRPATLPASVLSHLGQQLRTAFVPSHTRAEPADFADLIGRLEVALKASAKASADALRQDLVASIPALRSFALSLTYNQDRADDLVQDTLVRAWAKADSFTPGTHLIAWLFTILRNLFYSEQRKRGRELEDVDGALAERHLISLPEQDAHLEFEELRRALGTIPAPQRDALILVGAQGLPYEEAAAICGVPVGTIKSRVNRARTALVERLGMHDTSDIGADAVTRAASSSGS